MEIYFEIKGRCYSVCIGKQTKRFGQIYLITVTEEFYDKLKVVYAKLLWHSWRFKEYRTTPSCLSE